ncbi:B12 binding domain-containing protein [Mesonia phycicola]|uniref:B12 binding domain-containing protein n=1 Tax=Mesonia phycicola TaxID=579105 RepID=A0A1M6A4F2_9FLAO|nr:MerR family transcriptional regulator [Mesonia phycicola]SHI31337.1 B12 binding domain-containing protein [Mesonia phycicola]
MAYIKKQFSIKDLEMLSGIKAHTLRMWEKRYDVLKPNRTETNIRTYELDDLQRLLNISFLNENGYKISRISKLDTLEINELVKNISSTNKNEDRAIKSLTLSMYNFDQRLFFETYNSLLKTKTFREIFQEVFIPFLNKIGLLWQTNSIDPIHEHFISNLIKQKLLLNIEQLQQQNPSNTSKNFVLFLPEDEIHDLGILYIHFEILLHGYQAIYLGHSLPLENLNFVKNIYNNIHFVSYFTVKPDDVDDYLSKFQSHILDEIDCNYWVLGKKLTTATHKPSDKITFFNSIEELTRKL